MNAPIITKDDIREAANLLRRYNEWRRGAEQEMENPTEIGKALDLACGVLERAEEDEEIASLKRMLEKTRGQLSKALDAVITLSVRNLELIAENKKGRAS